MKKWNSNGEQLCNSEKYSEALECYDKILSYYPKDFLAVFGKGMVFLKLKEYEKALQCFNSVLNMNSSYIPAIKNKQMIEEKLKKQESENYNKFSKLGVEFYKKGNFEKALNYFEKAFEINPYSETLRKNIEKTRLRLKETLPIRWNNKGVEYYKVKNYQKAFECFEKAVKLNPNFESALKNKAMVQKLIKN